MLLSLGDTGTSSTLCAWQQCSKPLTLIAERERRHFGVVLTLMNDDNTITVVCPSPRSIARFCVDGVRHDILQSPLQLQRRPSRVEFCISGLVVAIHVSPLAEQQTPAQPSPSAIAASTLACMENLCKPASEDRITGT